MDYFPAIPPVVSANHATGKTFLRYEDICQDGRILLEGIPHALGMVVWYELLLHHPISVMARRKGIIPILTRLCLSGDESPVAVANPLTVDGGFALAHGGSLTAVERLFLNVWTELSGPVARPGAKPAAAAGPSARVGRVFAEHIFTRLFAAPGERKVVALEHPDLPAVPPAHHDWRPPNDLLDLPTGGEWLDDDWTSPAMITFALNHTDSNQHVNSLVYLRLFEHEVGQHLARRGRAKLLLARHAELTYRKPCFAGDQVAIAMRCFTHQGHVGAAGCFIDSDELRALAQRPPQQARCFVRILFNDRTP